MRAVSLIALLLPMSLASPFTFPSQPNQRHVTLTAQDGRPLVLTIAQTITRTSTITPTMPTPPSFPGSSGPRKTGRPEEEDELELRAIFASTAGSSDSAASTSTSTSSEDADSDSSSDSDSDSDSGSGSDTNSDSGESEAQTSVQAVVAAAQTTPAPPANDPEVASALAEQGYSQVTYYTCMTRDATYTHCGWHVPVVKVSGAAKDGSRGSLRLGIAALGVACVVGFGNIVFGG
ncbi:hypothetical protein VM1G_08633 [Cytospora mali]|uniref:Uncharacterized protein n=1 Tax=Cytospora mali TaxID=578113 RepID=A0A194W7X5_CYTMA|nr:hypothetical protein VM1G_08633 [Valsa mali]